MAHLILQDTSDTSFVACTLWPLESRSRATGKQDIIQATKHGVNVVPTQIVLLPPLKASMCAGRVETRLIGDH